MKKPYKVCYLGHPDKPFEWQTGPKLNQRFKAEYKDLDQAWRHFLDNANHCMIFGDEQALYEGDKILAYTFVCPNYKDPEWDEFDRYRVRVTGAMPSSMKLKLIQEVKSGKRHMREF
jgi:hypothetical protein